MIHAVMTDECAQMQNMPKSLYHYKIFDRDHLESLVLRNVIKFKMPKLFNDPWDCRPYFYFPDDPEGRKRNLDWVANAYRKQCPSMPDDQIKAKISELAASPQKVEQEFKKMNENIYEGISKKYRVYCLSEVDDSLLMWSHYGDSHKGICMEFDASKTPFMPGEIAQKVQYADECPKLDVASNDYSALITKSKIWDYELEWRLIAEERSESSSKFTIKTEADYLKIPCDALLSITVGAKAEEETKAVVSEIVSKSRKNILIKTAFISENNYRIEIK
jgi:Protein of unknown function (DUF2971)